MKKVLIIDDEPDTVTFLGAWLEDKGYAVYSARDGKEGMAAILAERPDLVLMDLKMPNQTGMQLYRDIRYRDELKDLPVIFITGLTEINVFSSDCTPLPKPTAYIDKPINLQSLNDAITKAIG